MGELFDARAFALGMVALVNPCGFALLPAYLGYFLGMNDGTERESRIVALNRAQIISLSMSAAATPGMSPSRITAPRTADGNADRPVRNDVDKPET